MLHFLWSLGGRILPIMMGWTAFIAPLALLLPQAQDDAREDSRALLEGDEKTGAVGSQSEQWTAFQPWLRIRPPMQIQIERRVTIKIRPARPPKSNLVADLPRQIPSRLAERKMGGCLPIKDVRAVQTGGPSKLILFMRNRQMISAQLEKACSARDFYSGFYVEPSKDGNLCINRDQLQSRNGTKCEVSGFSRLELVRN